MKKTNLKTDQKLFKLSCDICVKNGLYTQGNLSSEKENLTFIFTSMFLNLWGRSNSFIEQHLIQKSVLNILLEENSV